MILFPFHCVLPFALLIVTLSASSYALFNVYIVQWGQILWQFYKCNVILLHKNITTFILTWLFYLNLFHIFTVNTAFFRFFHVLLPQRIFDLLFYFVLIFISTSFLYFSFHLSLLFSIFLNVLEVNINWCSPGCWLRGFQTFYE